MNSKADSDKAVIGVLMWNGCAKSFKHERGDAPIFPLGCSIMDDSEVSHVLDSGNFISGCSYLTSN